MNQKSISDLAQLNDVQKTLLLRGKVIHVVDAFRDPPEQIAKRCGVSPLEIRQILDLVLRCELLHIPTLADSLHEDEAFTTGDTRLDQWLGCGIRTGMLWEIVGESSAGKTQIALQLSLFVQLPLHLRGLNGAVCYLTTSATLPTNRLSQILAKNPLLSSRFCSLDHIHTMSVPTIPILLHVLSETLPTLLSQWQGTIGNRPFKLLVIDALAELFHTSGQTNAETLVQRSHNIVAISTLLQFLATRWKMAIIILNEVVDVFQNESTSTFPENQPDLDYKTQSRWFNRGSGDLGRKQKEASLGLVWANQVNARIFLTRAEPQCHVAETQLSLGPQRDGHTELQFHPVRCMTLNFNNNGCSNSRTCQFVVTGTGISVVSEISQELAPHTPAKVDSDNHSDVHQSRATTPITSDDMELTLIVPSSQEEENWEQYWDFGLKSKES